MDDIEVGKYWDANAEAWTHLSRAGFDQCRDVFNTPGFLSILPEVRGKKGLDLGCGEGHNTRLVASRGASMTAIDISETFLRHAAAKEKSQPLGIRYQRASGQSLPFADASFDFVISTMCLMDMPRPELAIREAARVLRPGGFLQFSITHPCFQTAKWNWILDEQGKRSAMIVGDYFDPPPGRIDVWTFGAAPAEEKKRWPKFRIPRFDFTLSWWLNNVIDAGLHIERILEPSPDDQTLREHPNEADARIIAYFLHIRASKPN